MASKEAMLPWLGHSVVVLSNANQNPARFAVVLQILDFLTGNPAYVCKGFDIIFGRFLTGNAAYVCTCRHRTAPRCSISF